MRPFVEWIETRGFWVDRTWSDSLGEFIMEPSKIRLWPHHRKIFDHVLTINPDTGRFPYRTFIFSCPKKSGKTAWDAAIGSWYAEEIYGGAEIYVLANDKEQAEGRAMKAIKFNYDRRNDEIMRGIRDGLYEDEDEQIYTIEKYRLVLPSKTTIQVLSQHYTSAAGGQSALTLWDELWGYTSESNQRMWEEMTIPPTEKYGMRVVVTYAGFEGESHTLWNLYENTVLNGIRLREEFPDLPCYTNQQGTTFVYWDHEPRMPWQTPEYYEAEIGDLRPVQFRRLHLNEWGSAEDQFIPIELWDKAADKLEAPLQYMTGTERVNYPISIGVDVGVTRDSTAVIGVYSFTEQSDDGKDSGMKLGVAFHRIWTPAKGYPVDPAEVQAYIEEMYAKFHVNAIVIDPTHFYQNMFAMKRAGLPIREYKQNVGNMVAASTALYDALRTGRLEAYPADDIREHILFAAAKLHGSGFRIVKLDTSTRPNDAAIALAMAVVDAIERGGEDTSVEQTIASPFGEITGLDREDEKLPDEETLPEALRKTTFSDRVRALEELSG